MPKCGKFILDMKFICKVSLYQGILCASIYSIWVMGAFQQTFEEDMTAMFSSGKTCNYIVWSENFLIYSSL